jgi:hypothetical protein
MTFRLRSLMLVVIVAGLELFAWTRIRGDLFGDVSLDSWPAKAFVLFYINAFSIVFVGIPVRFVFQAARLLSASDDRDRAIDGPATDPCDETPGT